MAGGRTRRPCPRLRLRQPVPPSPGLPLLPRGFDLPRSAGARPGYRPLAARRAGGAVRGTRRAPDARGDRGRGQPRLGRRASRLRLRALRRVQGRRLEVRPLARRGADAARAGRRRLHRAGPLMAYKSKTLATWIALVGGSLGLHRFYLHGFADRLGWLHPWPTLAGVLGVQRMLAFG